MWLERHWQRVTIVSALLYPISVVFRAVVAFRRFAYKRSLFRTIRLGVPVVIVGNVTVGGTGKTPLVLWLAEFLSQQGFRPGIVSRGYGAAERDATAVTPVSDAARVGDEPVLLAQRSGCPVWIGRDRVAAALGLLRSNTGCDVIISDDGLQHYRMARDVEIAVIDGSRKLGNGFMLPAGPLREPASRFREMDAIVINGGTRAADPARRAVSSRLEGNVFRNLLNPEHAVSVEFFQRRRVHAVAGIGNPARFFEHLQTLGLDFEAHAFADHYAFSAADLQFANCDAIVMTEKDAVKCASFANETQWALRVDAVPDVALGKLILRKLDEE